MKQEEKSWTNEAVYNIHNKLQ